MELDELWDRFLTRQAELFFKGEVALFAKESFWGEASSVLEIGSGYGIYLSMLAEKFVGKEYLGLEQNPSRVEQANRQFKRPGLQFQEGDAEVEIEGLKGKFDVVLFRFTLQHLKNPRLALQIANDYLKPNGHIIIIDSYDPAAKRSHKVPTLDLAIEQLNAQRKTPVNRYITMEIMDEYNLKDQGNVSIRFETEEDRKRYYTHIMLFLEILHKQFDIPVDFQKAQEELQVYLDDETSWVCPGMHLLILKREER